MESASVKVIFVEFVEKKIDLGEPLTKTTDSFMVPEEKKDDRDPFSVGQSETDNEKVSSPGGACATIGVSSSTAADRSRQARLALPCLVSMCGGGVLWVQTGI